MSVPTDPKTGTFATSEAHLRAELARLDVVLAAYVESHWREETDADGELTDETVAWYLAHEPDRTPTAIEAVRGATKRLDTQTARTAAAGRAPRLSELAGRVGLERPALDILVAALAPDIDWKYARLYGYLQGDSRAGQPTIGLLSSLFDMDPLTASSPLAVTAPLRTSGLVDLSGDATTPRTYRPVTVPDQVRAYLLEEDEFLTESWLTLTPALSVNGGFQSRIGPEGIAAANRLVTLSTESPETPPLAIFGGGEGIGRTEVATIASERLDRPLLAADDATALNASHLETLRMEALLRDATVFIKITKDRETTWDKPRQLLQAVDDIPGPVIVALSDLPPASAYATVTNHTTLTIEFPRPSVRQRREYWDRQALPADADPAALAAAFRLPPGGIDAAMTTAQRLARSTGVSLSADHVLSGARAQTGEALADLAERIEPRYTWDDIVLSPDQTAQLREAAAWLRHSGRVYEEWGFERRFAAGTGLTALFSGPSGTGKTMAAEVLAGAAGLELYRVDLSTVVDKYVGETESNLGQVFDAAANVDAVLLFDEADALFGSRSAVSDAQDRYANVEVNYLLQRIEAHEGPVILTTNLKGNIDDAFLRRIDLGIDFSRPDCDARTAIWQLVFPDETPVDALNVEYLAGFELTGGNIENIARTAAFLAADDPDADRVTMTHVVRAVRREFQKNGRLTMPEDFDGYGDLLRP